MHSGMGLKHWLSNFDLKKGFTVILGVSIAILALDFIYQRLALVVALGVGFSLTLFWTKVRDEKGPECNIYSILMIIASCVLVITVVTLFHWGGCVILSEFRLFPKECRDPIQLFVRIIGLAVLCGALLAAPILLDLLNRARKRVQEMTSAIGRPCGISQRIIQECDNFFWIPLFPCDPQDPFAKYSGTCVLRDEFEKWELKEELARKVRGTWEQQYSTPEALKAFSVAFHDEAYFIVKERWGKTVGIVFWHHLFILDVWREKRKKFYDQMLGPVSEIALDLCAVKEKGETIEISVDSGGRQDCIELSLQEWEHFQSALRAAHETLSDR